MAADPLDLETLRALEQAAMPAPWEAGDPWGRAGVLPERFGPGRCAYCHHGEPVATCEMDINGEMMTAHTHRLTTPYADEHLISSQGGQVAGNYDWEAGGILSGADTALIVAARNALPAVLAEVERLREFEGAVRGSLSEAGTLRRSGEPPDRVALHLWTQVGDALKALDGSRGGNS